MRLIIMIATSMLMLASEANQLCFARGIEIRGFRAGMTLVEANEVARRELGSEVYAGFGEGDVGFFYSVNKNCSITGHFNHGRKRKWFEQIAQVPGVEVLPPESGKLLVRIHGAQLSLVNDVRIEAIQFGECFFGLESSDDVFRVFAKKFPAIGSDCFKFLPNRKKKGVQSFCLAGNEIVSFWKMNGGTKIIIVGTPESYLRENAKKAGIKLSR